MPKGYWIVRVDIADPEKYKAYTDANGPPLKKYGARFLVRAGRFENVEGASRTRNAVIEFPSYKAAVDCWHSPEYQKILHLRVNNVISDLILVDGVGADFTVTGFAQQVRAAIKTAAGAEG